MFKNRQSKNLRKYLLSIVIGFLLSPVSSLGQSIIASCKDQIPLDNGLTISKKNLVELIDADLKSLK